MEAQTVRNARATKVRRARSFSWKSSAASVTTSRSTGISPKLLLPSINCLCSWRWISRCHWSLVPWLVITARGWLASIQSNREAASHWLHFRPDSVTLRRRGSRTRRRLSCGGACGSRIWGPHRWGMAKVERASSARVVRTDIPADTGKRSSPEACRHGLRYPNGACCVTARSHSRAEAVPAAAKAPGGSWAAWSCAQLCTRCR